MIQVTLNLQEIVSRANLRAANDQLRKVETASAVDYTVADVTAALLEQGVDVVPPAAFVDADEASPELPTAAAVAEAKVLEAEKRVGA